MGDFNSADDFIQSLKKAEAGAMLVVKRALNDLQRAEPVFLIVLAINRWNPKELGDTISLGGAQNISINGVCPSPAMPHIVEQLEDLILRLKSGEGGMTQE